MLKKTKLLMWVAAVVLLSMGRVTFGQISDAQIWDVQMPNDYSGGARGREGFFFSAEGMYMALPGPKSGIVGNRDAEETAYTRTWTITNDSGMVSTTIETDSGDDDDSSSNSTTVEIYDPTRYDPIWNDYSQVSELEMTVQQNSWNTNMLDDKWEVGQRYAFGFMNGHHGWECSVFTIGGKEEFSGNQVQVGFNDDDNSTGGNVLSGIFNGGWGTDMWKTYFDDTAKLDPETGDIHVERMLVEFNEASMYNDINVWGVELNYLRRAHPTQIGMFEFGLGVRYMRWDEEFGFWGGASSQLGNGESYAPNFMDDTTWTTEADNQLAGPQIALRWSRQTARFSMEIIGKFTAAVNAQSVSNYCAIATNPTGIGNAYWNNSLGEDEAEMFGNIYESQLGSNGKGRSDYHKDSFTEFSPLVELGVKFNFNLTHAIKLSFGWNGIYAANLARPSEMTNYSLSNTNGLMGILAENNDSDAFMHGFTFGIVINR
ncbi:MAG: BBP7 family outer membrane beta-barrel protein [Planctomycetia bacterium]|nr:BBP7 family outer membrane beta-barrel protein [Planctomycetia bacterium]